MKRNAIFDVIASRCNMGFGTMLMFYDWETGRQNV